MTTDGVIKIDGKEIKCRYLTKEEIETNKNKYFEKISKYKEKVVKVICISKNTVYIIHCKYKRKYEVNISLFNGEESIFYAADVYYVNKKGEKFQEIKYTWGDYWSETEEQCLEKVIDEINFWENDRLPQNK